MGFEMKIRDSRTDGDKLKQFVDIWADSASDIPTAKTDWVAGSIAYAIDTGVFYVLSSSGVWVNQDESSATNAVSPTSLSLSKGQLETIGISVETKEIQQNVPENKETSENV